MEQKSKITTLRGNTTSTYPSKPNSGVPGNSRVNGIGGRDTRIYLFSISRLLQVPKTSSRHATHLVAWLVDEVKRACRTSLLQAIRSVLRWSLITETLREEYTAMNDACLVNSEEIQAG
jgi:hypothetical protein